MKHSYYNVKLMKAIGIILFLTSIAILIMEAFVVLQELAATLYMVIIFLICILLIMYVFGVLRQIYYKIFSQKYQHEEYASGRLFVQNHRGTSKNFVHGPDVQMLRGNVRKNKLRAWMKLRRDKYLLKKKIESEVNVKYLAHKKKLHKAYRIQEKIIQDQRKTAEDRLFAAKGQSQSNKGKINKKRRPENSHASLFGNPGFLSIGNLFGDFLKAKRAEFKIWHALRKQKKCFSKISEMEIKNKKVLRQIKEKELSAYQQELKKDIIALRNKIRSLT